MKKYLLMLLTFFGFITVVNAEATVASIGENYYSTLDAAIEAATSGAEIKLLANVNSDFTISADKQITLNLNNFTINSEFDNNGDLSIVGPGKIVIQVEGSGIFASYNRENAKLLFNNVDVEYKNDLSASYYLNNDGTVVFKDTDFNATGSSSLTNFLYNDAVGTVTFESGTYQSEGRLFYKNHGKMIINGGTFSSASINYNLGDLTVNGGTFKTIGDITFFQNQPGGLLTLNNGTFDVYSVAYNAGDGTNSEEGSDIIINGGTYNVTDTAFWQIIAVNSSVVMNGGTINSSSVEPVFSLASSDENAKLTITGGIINAPKSEKISYDSSVVFTYGIDDGTVKNDNPTTYLNAGSIDGINIAMNFYDGKMILKNKLDDVSVTTPKGYILKYDTNEDGTYTAYLEKEVDKYWEKFVEAFKTNEYAKELLGEDSGITVSHTDNSLTVTMVDTEENKTYVTKFTYDSETGIVTYVPIDEVNADNMADAFMDSIWILNTLYAISDVKGYDSEKVLDWMETLENPTIAKDGVAYTSKVFEIKEEGEGASVDMSIEYFTSYELDIINGLKTFNNTSKPVTNPSTGISFPIIFVLIALVFGFGVYLIRNKKYFSRG